MVASAKRSSENHQDTGKGNEEHAEGQALASQLMASSDVHGCDNNVVLSFISIVVVTIETAIIFVTEAVVVKSP